MSYAERYSWFRPIDDHCIGHDDGAVSLMLNTKGFDICLTDDQTIESHWGFLRDLLRSIDPACYLEMHFFREDDDSVAQAYLARNKDITRAHEIGRRIREDIASHLARYGRSNSQCFILTIPNVWRWWKGASGKLKDQDQNAERLKEIAERLLRYVPQGSLAKVSDYEKMICRSYYRDQWIKQKDIATDHRFPLNEQIVHTKPKSIGNGTLKIGDTYTQVALVTLFPDAKPGWFEAYAALSEIDIHISQIITPMNTEVGMAQADQAVLTQQSLHSDRGGEYVREKISELQGFKEFVAHNNLKLFKSCFIVHMHCKDPSILKRCWEKLEDGIGRGGVVISNQDIALACFRFGQPGQGYKTSFLRPDHELQVANMMPLVVFDEGVEQPDMLRLTYQSQLVGLSYKENEANNAFGVGKTGGGKGSSRSATILETYPLGTDWYIAEIGDTYRWVVEALGGDYCQLDPNSTVVNPLPEYKHADLTAEYPFPSQVASSTLDAIRFILLDDIRDYKLEEKAVAEDAFYILYAVLEGDTPPTEKAPNLGNYLEVLELFADEKVDVPDDQKRAAEFMVKKLNSFLSQSTGKIFLKPDNFSISDGIFGVDFKPLLEDKKLMIFYLIFISMRYSQMCFANKRPSRILIDEIHRFTEAQPTMMKSLISSVSRMGRKESGAFDGVTQNIADFTSLDPSITKQMTHRNLLYTQSGHKEILDIVPNMTQRAYECWKSYPDPQNTQKMDYRQGLHMMGDKAWDIYYTFPESVMLLANTDPDVLELKAHIGKKTKDTFERMQMLKEAIAKHRTKKPSQNENKEGVPCEAV